MAWLAATKKILLLAAGVLFIRPKKLLSIILFIIFSGREYNLFYFAFCDKISY